MTDLIMDKKPKSPISEAYRTIRTNIEFSSIDSKINTLLVTSPGPEDGKTTTVSNIALAFAQAGKKTLLIDCDLRKPKLYKMFKISNRLGITNIMAGDAKLEDVLYKFSDNLDILPAGTVPPNPSEILSSKKMKSFLEEALKVYDKIIIDSPPVNAVTDAQILSTIVEGVLLIVSSEKTQIEGAKRAKELLDKVNANILGVVLRRLKLDNSKYGYSNYYYYHEHEGDLSKRRKNKNDRHSLPPSAKN